MNLKGTEGERQYTSEPQNVSELFQAAMTRSTRGVCRPEYSLRTVFLKTKAI